MLVNAYYTHTLAAYARAQEMGHDITKPLATYLARLPSRYLSKQTLDIAPADVLWTTEDGLVCIHSPLKGGNDVASETTPFSTLRWRGCVACEYIMPVGYPEQKLSDSE